MLLVLALPAVAGSDTPVRLPELPPARGEQCVEPVPVIRRDHMKFLLHQRDDTVHLGERGARHSLVGCIDCHAAKDTAGRWMPINAKGQFCEACHAFAAVRMDCFECHAAKPEDGARMSGFDPARVPAAGLGGARARVARSEASVR